MNESPPPVTENRDYHTVMIHFYRGELGRIMLWRQRLDVTTNWAIIASTGIITFALNAPSNSHLVFMLANLLCLNLLLIEGRRYRYYDAFRSRVRLLETQLILPVMMNQTPGEEWKQVMAEDLLRPSFKISLLNAITRRFRRNYIYIFLVVLVAWIMKWHLHTPDNNPFLQILRSPGSAVSIFTVSVILFYLFLVLLLIRAIRTPYFSGEFTYGTHSHPIGIKI